MKMVEPWPTAFACLDSEDMAVEAQTKKVKKAKS